MGISRSVLNRPEETFRLGEAIGSSLQGGEVILMYGGLGAGKTLLTKGILSGLEFDVDEVTSPSFTLVNLYKTKNFDVYHIDLWRVGGGLDAAGAVGLDDILDNENAVVIVEWADRLGQHPICSRAVRIHIDGVGDDPRTITVEAPQ